MLYKHCMSIIRLEAFTCSTASPLCKSPTTSGPPVTPPVATLKGGSGPAYRVVNAPQAHNIRSKGDPHGQTLTRIHTAKVNQTQCNAYE